MELNSLMAYTPPVSVAQGITKFNSMCDWVWEGVCLNEQRAHWVEVFLSSLPKLSLVKNHLQGVCWQICWGLFFWSSEEVPVTVLKTTCERMLGGIMVCNSLLRAELPAAAASNNAECCRLTYIRAAHTLNGVVSSCLKAVRRRRKKEADEREKGEEEQRAESSQFSKSPAQFLPTWTRVNK